MIIPISQLMGTLQIPTKINILQDLLDPTSTPSPPTPIPTIYSTSPPTNKEIEPCILQPCNSLIPAIKNFLVLIQWAGLWEMRKSNMLEMILIVKNLQTETNRIQHTSITMRIPITTPIQYQTLEHRQKTSRTSLTVFQPPTYSHKKILEICPINLPNRIIQAITLISLLKKKEKDRFWK